MKAQSFFGGTNPKETGEAARQVGQSNASPGANSIVNNSQNVRDGNTMPLNLRPPITRYSNGGMGNNSQMIRDGKTRPVHRPHLKGKQDNRKVGQ